MAARATADARLPSAMDVRASLDMRNCADLAGIRCSGGVLTLVLRLLELKSRAESTVNVRYKPTIRCWVVFVHRVLDQSGWN